jgi:hypothetical protein
LLHGSIIYSVLINCGISKLGKLKSKISEIMRKISLLSFLVVIINLAFGAVSAPLNDLVFQIKELELVSSKMISDRLPEMQKICLNLKEECFNTVTDLKAEWGVEDVRKEGPKSECNYSLEKVPAISEKPDSVYSAGQCLDVAIYRNLYLMEEFNKLNSAIRYYGAVLKVIEEEKASKNLVNEKNLNK